MYAGKAGIKGEEASYFNGGAARTLPRRGSSAAAEPLRRCARTRTPRRDFHGSGPHALSPLGPGLPALLVLPELPGRPRPCAPAIPGSDYERPAPKDGPIVPMPVPSDAPVTPMPRRPEAQVRLSNRRAVSPLHRPAGFAGS